MIRRALKLKLKYSVNHVVCTPSTPLRAFGVESGSTQSPNSKVTEGEAKAEVKDKLKVSSEEGPKEQKHKQKTQAQLDEELRQKLEGISGEGGEAGMELEDGHPVSMKRGVRNNMFRYI